MMKIPITGRSDHLPEEIMEEILCRLHVKPLLRFRCVSKSYRSLIDSKRFIKLHLQKSTTSLAHHRVLFLSDTRSPKPKVSGCSLLSFLDSSSYLRTEADVLSVINPEELINPSEINTPKANMLSLINPSELNSPLLSCFESSSYKTAPELNIPTNIPPYYAISCLGCCNGLVCILLERNNNFGFQFMLWNPSTRIFKEVPLIDKNKMIFTCYGFGWDESSDDYKIVAIVKVEGQNQTTKIYSSKSGSWKQNDGWDGLSRSWYLSDKVVFTTGTLQWECRDSPQSPWELVAFDLKHEVFQIVEQPFSYDECNPLLGTFGECLAVMWGAHDDYKDIWVMKEFGVKESWEKIMVLDDFDTCGIWTSPSVAASYNGGIGEIIFMDIEYYAKYLVYNEDKKCFYCATSLKDFFTSHIHSKIYIESLVSPLE